MREEIGDRVRLLETQAALVHTALARRDLDAAAHHAAIILARLEPNDRAALRQEAYYAAFRLAEAQDDSPRTAQYLAWAIQAQDELATNLPPADRQRFLDNVPLNREVSAAARQHTRTAIVELGQGQHLRTVTWTLHAPHDQLIEDPTARRRHILARLLAEAEAQAASPTHDQLATALGVSRRTILRDLAAIDSLTPPQPGD